MGKQWNVFSYSIRYRGYEKIWEGTFSGSPIKDDKAFKEKRWARELENNDSVSFRIIHTESDTLLGEVTLDDLKSDVPELGIHLLEKHRGQGIGTDVIGMTLQALKQNGAFNRCIVKIFSDNRKSKVLFQKFGAKQIGTEWEEYVEMIKKLAKDIGRDKLDGVLGQPYEEKLRHIVVYQIDL